MRSFVECVVKHSLKLKSSLSARELHQSVERVDEALLAKEQHIMELGARISEINGMLLDPKALRRRPRPHLPLVLGAGVGTRGAVDHYLWV